MNTASHLVEDFNAPGILPRKNDLVKKNNHLPAGVTSRNVWPYDIVRSIERIEQVLPSLAKAKRHSQINRKHRRQLASPKWRKQQEARLALEAAMGLRRA